MSNLAHLVAPWSFFFERGFVFVVICAFLSRFFLEQLSKHREYVVDSSDVFHREVIECLFELLIFMPERLVGATCYLDIRVILTIW